MAQNTTTTSNDETVTADDLRHEVPTARFQLANNNKEVAFYPDVDAAEYGVIKHEYEGLPGRGVVLYDVTGWETVDKDIDTETREWISAALFGTGGAEGNMSHVDTHTIKVTNPYEGDSYTVKLETANKRRDQ
ncbi:hypothetical protein [Halorubrum halodurans]|uniref:hypothetical protein n=1 Tax=Halorubrum halodurans TaxID=1383851 RepID=UPI0015C593DB|nr:hypothetical protein [Halorubrum halodurans]